MKDGQDVLGRERNLDDLVRGKNKSVLRNIEVRVSACTVQNLHKGGNMRRNVGDIVDLPFG